MKLQFAESIIYQSYQYLNFQNCLGFMYDFQFEIWVMENTYIVLCILGRYQRPQQVISVGTTRRICIYGKIQREFDYLTSSNHS